MSVIQLEELVSYQLRTSYLNEIPDGVGERLITVNDGFLNSAPFKAAGWRPNPSHIKRTHSPPIPTAVASEYFQAPRHAGLTLEDGEEDGGMLTGGGADTVGPGAATKRRRRREQMMEEEDSSDLSDESDDEPSRAAQQIRFAKMPVRHRAGSSPTRTPGAHARPGTASPRAPRRGSQSTTDSVRTRGRSHTVTSSEVSSDNEFEVTTASKHREAARAAARAVKMQANIEEEPVPGVKRTQTIPLPEEEEEDSDEGSDMSADFVGSVDSGFNIDGDENVIHPSPTRQVVGTPPKNFTRQPTIRRSQAPVRPTVLSALPPPRPMSTIRPISMMKPQSLLSAAFKAKQTNSGVPFEKYAHYRGQGAKESIAVRLYAAFSKTPGKPYEVMIGRKVHDGKGTDRPPTVADLIGLGLYRYNEEKMQPPLPADKLNINWWMLRMVEDGEVDDDFPPFDRTKGLASFTTVNNASARGGGRQRAGSTAFDEFALVAATEEEFLEHQEQTPQKMEAEGPTLSKSADDVSAERRSEESASSKQPAAGAASLPPARARLNPIVTTTYRSNAPLADAPQAPASAPNTMRGQQKLLRIHIMTADLAPGQMVTLDVTTDTYLAEVLDEVCRKRQIDKANHVLKLPGSAAVAMPDRPVSSIGNVADLELHRRRFATDGPLSMTGSSPGTGSGNSPKMSAMSMDPSSASASAYASGLGSGAAARRHRKGGNGAMLLGPHPLAREALKQDELGSSAVGGSYKKYVVYRKQPMRIVGLSERTLAIDGEYIHIVPSSGGKELRGGGGKATTVHFSNVIGCKVLRKHPSNVKLVVYKATESKRYDFEAKSVEEAAEIVKELKKGISPYREV